MFWKSEWDLAYFAHLKRLESEFEDEGLQAVGAVDD